MERLAIETVSWIWKARTPWPQGNLRAQGVTVDLLVPPLFEVYGRILHPFNIDGHETDELTKYPDLGRKNQEIAAAAIRDYALLKKYGAVAHRLQALTSWFFKSQATRWTHASWQCIAEKYGIVFHNDISPKSFAAKFKREGYPRNLNFPDEGNLPATLLSELVRVFKEYSLEDNVIIYQSPPNSLFREGRPEDVLRCTHEEVLHYFQDGFIGYLYAVDKSWIIFTDTDLLFTLIGCPQELMALLKNTSLEVVSCSAASRVDDASDRINDLKY